MGSPLRGRDPPSEMEGGDKILLRRHSSVLSPAQLNLERLYVQNRARQQQNDGAKATEPSTPGAPAKGKPRLLLMGQRRQVTLLQHTTKFI